MTAEEVKAIFDSKLDRIKKLNPISKYAKANYDDKNEYAELIKNMQRIKVQTEPGVFPIEDFIKSAPNMDPAEITYLKNNYKNPNLPIYVDYISTICRAFSDTNWSIEYKKDEGKETFQEYVEKLIPVYGSLEFYMKSILPNLKTVDATGFTCFKPYSIEFETVIDENEKEIQVIKTDQLFEPYPVYYCTDKVYEHERGEYLLVLTSHKSDVVLGSETKKEGLVFELYDENDIWVISQYGEQGKWLFNVTLLFHHELEILPYIELKGIPKVKEDRLCWLSPYLFICDILDIISINTAFQQAAIRKTAFPYRVAMGVPCEYTEGVNGEYKCLGGQLNVLIGDQMTIKSCPSCHGTGLKSRISALGEFLFKPPSLTQGDGESKFTGEYIKYVAPDTAILNFIEEKNEKDSQKARSVLHLHTSNTIVKGTESMTATGMAMDEKAKFAFIKTFSDQAFDWFELANDITGMMRYGKERYAEMKPTIIRPVSFDFKTEQEYMLEISQAIAANLPPFVIITIIYRYLKSIFFNDIDTFPIFNLISHADRLLIKPESEIDSDLNRGNIMLWEKILHDSSVFFVQQMLIKNPDYFKNKNNTLEKQIADLFEMAKEKESQIKESKVVTVDTLQFETPQLN